MKRAQPAGIQFAVDEVVDSASEIDPESLTVWRHSEDEWNSLDTEVTERADGSLVIQAETPGTSVFIISADAAPNATDESNESDEAANESNESDEAANDTDEQATEDADEETDSETESAEENETNQPPTEETDEGIPGFGIGVALVALILTAVIARRRK